MVSALVIACAFMPSIVFGLLWARAARRLDEVEHIRRLGKMCGFSGFSSPHRCSTNDLLRLLDQNRPAGVSLRRVVAELHLAIEKGAYP